MMDETTCDRIVAEVVDGRRVAAVYQSHRQIETAFPALEARAAHVPGMTVYRAAGNKRLSHISGGCCWFVTVSGCRGLSVDQVVVDPDVKLTEGERRVIEPLRTAPLT